MRLANPGTHSMRSAKAPSQDCSSNSDERFKHIIPSVQWSYKAKRPQRVCRPGTVAFSYADACLREWRNAPIAGGHRQSRWPHGLLSWGVDPVDQGGSLGADSESWRMWITTRLATAVCAMGPRAGSDQSPPLWALALLRLDLDGIDPGTFQVRNPGKKREPESR